MSEPKLISPLLDNFVMGDPISDRNGIRCCPAINKNTDERYIVKIISVPASSVQLDALLLTGAFASKEAAIAYYKDIADSVTAEAEVLQKLSQLEGFLPIEGFQVEPMEDGSGYDVYLLSAYRNTLRHLLRRNNMTHLQAINLGLDLCSALAASRRMGYLYADLKPTNIYLSGTQEYRIGDIGFITLSSLQYQSLPDRYRSEYTAPEIADAFSSLNTTIDIYAIGMVLYQVFNGGQLPSCDGDTTSDELAPPAYADYEMSEIILKACATDPEQRWQDPVEMGQALVNYMQRNGAHDTPIIPAVNLVSEEDNEPEEGKYEETVTEDSCATSDAETDKSVDVADIDSVDPAAVIEEVTEDSIFTEDSDGNLTLVEDDVDETAEEQDGSEIEYDEVSAEVSDMLSQADELIAHEAPEPVIAPEPIEVTIPPVPEEADLEDADDESTVNESESENASDSNESEQSQTCEQVDGEEDCDEADANDEADVEADDEAENEDEYYEDEYAPVKKRNGWIVWLFALLAAAALIIAGFYGYKNYYLQSIDSIALTGGENGLLTVSITTETDENALTVFCTDTYGIQKKATVKNGKATFTDLKPDSAYTIKVEIEGFHKLVGETTASYATPAQIEILQFTAKTGAEDGSVILNFNYTGPEPEEWTISYTDTNGNVETKVFTENMLTIPGLEIGHEYTFTLDAECDMGMIGINTVTHVAKKVIKPQNLIVTGCFDGKLTAEWTIEDSEAVEGWIVHCYNDTFKTEPQEITDCSVAIDIPDVTASYVLEVVASGMSVGEQVVIPENSITVKDFTIDNAVSAELKISWVPANEVPAGGWILKYTADNSSPTEIVITEGNSAVIDQVVPGAKYSFELLSADKALILGSQKTYTVAKAKEFNEYKITPKNLSFKTYLTGKKTNYTTTFKIGEKASIYIASNRKPNYSSNKVVSMFVIRDKDGNIVDIQTSVARWRDMWDDKECYLNIPQIPQVAGDYTVSLFFNGALVKSDLAFTVK